MAKTIGAILDRDEVLDSIVFDIIYERRTTRARQVTSHEIEGGSKISDNLIDDNIIISFQAEIGNIDMTRETQITAKANDAYLKLVDLYNAKALIDYQTGFELFEDMIITNVNVIEQMGSPGALIADITLQEVLITQKEQVAIPQSVLGTSKAKKQLSSEINRGRQELIQAESKPTVIPFDSLL